MSKIWKLYVCEQKKALQKKSTIVIIVLAILSLLVSVGFVKLVDYLNNNMSHISEYDWKEELEREKEEIKSNLEKNKKVYTNETIAERKSMITYYEIALEHDMNIYNGYHSWRVQLLEEVRKNKQRAYLAELTGEMEEFNQLEEKSNGLLKMIKEDDYDAYIQEQINDLTKQFERQEIGKEEYEDALYIKELTKKYGINKNEDVNEYWKDYLLEEIETIQASVRTGIDLNQGKVLNDTKLAELEEVLKLDLYRLEHNIATRSSTQNGKTIYNYLATSFSMFFVAIFGIILAGGSIATEVSKGTIKFWSMLPAKRWKILLAKLISILVMTIVLTIVLSLVSFTLGNLFFEEEADPYLYVKDSQVKCLDAFIYNILYYLSYDIDIVVYIVLAMLISVLARNTALAVALSSAMYAGSAMVMQILNIFIKADWMRFVPFNNMSLTNKIFANTSSYLQTQGSLNNVSIGFSVSVLGVCVILMLVTMFDSFNKRDIV